MVTPENGTIRFVGASGREYNLSFYSSDVVAAFVTLSTDGLAGTGSQTFWNTPEQVTIADISVTTGQTVSTVAKLFVNDVATGNIFAWANVLNTLAFRSFPRLTISAGKKFTLIQA